MVRGLRVRRLGVQAVTPLDYLTWLSEALLAAAGAGFFWRRRVSVLWAWLGFRAIADLFCFSILKISGYRGYVWADHAQRNAQYALFAAACCITAGQILRENAKTRRFYLAGICIVIVLAVLRVNAVWPMPMSTFYGFEIWAEMILAGFVAFALGMANGRAPRPWGLIGCALVVMGGSDGLVTLLRQQAKLQNGPFASVLYGKHFEGWYPVGAIVGLGMLAWAGWRDYRLDEVRLPLGMNKPPTSVYREFEQRRVV